MTITVPVYPTSRDVHHVSYLQIQDAAQHPQSVGQHAQQLSIQDAIATALVTEVVAAGRGRGQVAQETRFLPREGQVPAREKEREEEEGEGFSTEVTT